MDLGEYLESKKKYCPLPTDNICEKFATQLEEKSIKCDERRATRLKAYLRRKCEMSRIANSLRLPPMKGGRIDPVLRYKKSMIPENNLLSKRFQPVFYEVSLWIKKEPVIIGNVTITVKVRYVLCNHKLCWAKIISILILFDYLVI